MNITKVYKFDKLWKDNRWLSPAYVALDDSGNTISITDHAPQEALAIEIVNGIALPGFQNAHSHAFQYAMAGLAEIHPAGIHDDFWTWREAMYQCALSVDPDSLQAIATMLYAEMLRHGYTHVAEFHYLHHDKNGKPYSNIAELGLRHLEAAKEVGIGITLIPVFYQRGGFALPAQERQRRFISKTTEDFLQLFESTKQIIATYKDAKLGWSIHSLRAVEEQTIIQTFNIIQDKIPFHIHIAEQLKEVDDCIQANKQRPAEWLLNHLPVNEHFHLVHATHLNDDEVKRLAASKANVVLCPSTEGNLGDGIFRMRDYIRQNGNWCIGTDSHIGLNPLEEWRMIDYRQRLTSHFRNTFDEDGASQMVNASVKNGRKAMGLSEKTFVKGEPFNVVVYNLNTPLLACTSQEKLWPTLVYTSDASHVLGTITAGKWRVKNNKHMQAESITQKFYRAIKTIQNR